MKQVYLLLDTIVNPEGEDLKAVIMVDAEYIEKILDRRSTYEHAKALDEDLYEVSFWDTCTFYYEELTTDDEERLMKASPILSSSTSAYAEFENNKYCLVDFDPKVGVDDVRTDMDSMVIGDSVHWAAVPRHGDGQIITQSVSFAVIRELKGLLLAQEAT